MIEFFKDHEYFAAKIKDVGIKEPFWIIGYFSANGTFRSTHGMIDKDNIIDLQVVCNINGSSGEIIFRF